MKEPDQVQCVRARLGQFIKLYPSLSAAFDSDNAALVFDLFMYHDAMRITRSAEFFALTDKQGADAIGFSVKRYRDGRDTLCDPISNQLFERQRKESVHGVSLYRADYERIHGWLTANGFDPPPRTDATDRVDKKETPDITKRQVQSLQNGAPFQNSKKNFVVDVAARERANTWPQHDADADAALNLFKIRFEPLAEWFQLGYRFESAEARELDLKARVMAATARIGAARAATTQRCYEYCFYCLGIKGKTRAELAALCMGWNDGDDAPVAVIVHVFESALWEFHVDGKRPQPVIKSQMGWLISKLREALGERSRYGFNETNGATSANPVLTGAK